jgi:flavin-dependent dehydrogenase
VRKHLKLNIKDVGIAFQYIIQTQDYKNIELFFDSELFNSWYAWIFPHKEYVSIGCGCDPRIFPVKVLNANFRMWLDKNNIDISKGVYQAHPINYDYKGYMFNNIFLIGDAAGFASGLTGEGIYQALVSGEEIAKIIIDEKYVSKRIDNLLKNKQTHKHILSLLEKSGPMRKAEYELLLLLLKIKLLDKELLKVLT